MGCLHPVEERHGVYEGRAVARPDRSLCSLCGELLYEPVRPRSTQSFELRHGWRQVIEREGDAIGVADEEGGTEGLVLDRLIRP